MSDTAATQPAGVRIKDPSNQSDTIAGSNGSDILVSDAGNDKLHGLGGTDTYVINNTNYDRTVQITDVTKKRLNIENASKAIIAQRYALRNHSKLSMLNGALKAPAKSARSRWICRKSYLKISEIILKCFFHSAARIYTFI